MKNIIRIILFFTSVTSVSQLLISLMYFFAQWIGYQL